MKSVQSFQVQNLVKNHQKSRQKIFKNSFQKVIQNLYKNRAAKGQTISKANYDFLNSPKKQTKLTKLSKEHVQDSEFRSFFGRIEEIIIGFRDLLTFTE